jgi:hypothetical protein
VTSIHPKDWTLSKLPFSEERRVRRWLKTLTPFQYMEAMGYIHGRLRYHEEGRVALPDDLDSILCASRHPGDRKGIKT